MKRLLYILTTLMLFVSCAQTPEFPLDQVALVSFKNWMAVNAPSAQPFNSEGDVYIKYYQRGAQMPDSLKIKDNLWIYLDYTGYRMDGTTIVTRDSVLSRVSGKWKNTTHWVDDFSQYRNLVGNYTICKGVSEVLPSLNKGDRVRIYMALNKAFSNDVTVNEGYLGETTDYLNFPCYFDIRVGSVLSNAMSAQKDTVRKFAAQKWGLQPQDTVFANVFMKKIKDNPAGDPITKDSTAKIIFKQTFLDGFYIKSTSDSIAKSYGRYNSSSLVQKILSIKPSENEASSDYPAFFRTAVLKMKRGEVAQFLVTSTYTTQGDTGDFNGTPQVLPYTPSIYTIYLLTKQEVKYQEAKK